MHTGPFDMPPVTLLRRVVDGQRDPSTRPWIQLVDQQPQHHQRHLLRPPPNAHQRVIKAIPIIANPRRHKPRTGRPASLREQHPRHDDRQPKGHPLIQRLGELGNHRRQLTNQRKPRFLSAPPLRIDLLKSPPPVMLRRPSLLMPRTWKCRTPPRPPPRLLSLCHPWLSC